MGDPRSVQTLQAFDVSVADRQLEHQLVDTFQVWSPTAQLQQVSLGAAGDIFSEAIRAKVSF